MQLTVRFLFLVLIVTFGFSASLFANSILYTFTTVSGVAGSFTFEESTPFNVTTAIFTDHYFGLQEPVVSAQSELSLTSGSFGSYLFSGTASIFRNDFLSPYDGALDSGLQDWWILHAGLSSNMVLGRSLTSLHLYDYLSPRTDMGPLIAPPTNPGCPPPGAPLCTNFQYAAIFSDGTTEAGGLASLTLVPESSSLALLTLGLVGIFAVKVGLYRSLQPVSNSDLTRG